ncbi:MAG: CopG family transcriptional regulator [Synechococcaceae cyanobacterium]|nr:CopG family transcriptional regulator [Synechococcaceae cyanobacterium]
MASAPSKRGSVAAERFSPAHSGAALSPCSTLQLDDDVLASARVLAGQRGESLGAVISALARRGLRQRVPLNAEQACRRNELLLLLPLQPEGSTVDLELVNSLRDELP